MTVYDGKNMNEYSSVKKKSFCINIYDYPIISLIVLLYSVYFFCATNLFNEHDLLAFVSSRIQRYARYIAVLLFFIYFFIYKAEKKFLYYFVCFFLFYLVVKKYTSSHLLFNLFFIPLFLSQFVNKQRLCKVLLIESLICFSIISIGHYFDYFQTESYSRLGLIRYTFGFVHPNTLGFIVLVFSFLYVQRLDTINIKDIAVIIFLIVFLYYIPRSVTPAFLLVLLSCFLIFLYLFETKIYSYFKNRRRKEILFFSVVFVYFSILFFTYFVSFTGFGKEFFLHMPGSIWARFELGYIAYERYGLSLFGTPIDSVFPDLEKGITEYFTVDCAYFFIPINYGVVTFASYIVFMLILFRQAIFTDNYKSVFILFLLILYGVSETLIIHSFLTPIFVCSVGGITVFDKKYS